MATHSSSAWRSPSTEEPGRLYSPRGRKETNTLNPKTVDLMRREIQKHKEKNAVGDRR